MADGPEERILESLEQHGSATYSELCQRLRDIDEDEIADALDRLTERRELGFNKEGYHR